MIIKETIGNIKELQVGHHIIDYLDLEWFETSKRIQRKHTRGGVEVAIKFLKEGQRLRQGDVLYQDEEKIIVVEIIPCDAIVINPKSMMEMGSICYEIGNKHLPIFIQNDQVLLPFEEPIFRWLIASGFNATKKHTQLLNMLNTNVQPHQHGSSSLFSKIMGMGQ